MYEHSVMLYLEHLRITR